MDERDSKDWTKVDVTKEVRDRLQAYKYRNRKKYKTVNDIVNQWLTKAEGKNESKDNI